MSRTKKGSKPCGWDYWGKRPIGMGDHGTKGKRIGIKKERGALKEQLLADVDEARRSDGRERHLQKKRDKEKRYKSQDE